MAVGGGGGSFSASTPSVAESGVNTGNGLVTITYVAPTLPTSKEQCKKGGWKDFGKTFKNQGQCVEFVEHENHAARLKHGHDH
jgi:hypothetical protein